MLRAWTPSKIGVRERRSGEVDETIRPVHRKIPEHQAVDECEHRRRRAHPERHHEHERARERRRAAEPRSAYMPSCHTLSSHGAIHAARASSRASVTLPIVAVTFCGGSGQNSAVLQRRSVAIWRCVSSSRRCQPRSAVGGTVPDATKPFRWIEHWRASIRCAAHRPARRARLPVPVRTWLRGRRRRIRRRRADARTQDRSHGPVHAVSQDLLDGPDDPLEFLPLRREPLSAVAGDRVVARAAVVVGRAPLGADPAVEQQPLQRRIQRALADLQHVVGQRSGCGARCRSRAARRAAASAGSSRSSVPGSRSGGWSSAPISLPSLDDGERSINQGRPVKSHRLTMGRGGT